MNATFEPPRTPHEYNRIAEQLCTDLTNERRRLGDRICEQPANAMFQPFNEYHEPFLRAVEMLDLASIPKMSDFQNEEPAKKLVIGSAEYVKKNERRMVLIRKKVRDVLSVEEDAEYERLQSEILTVTKLAFPHPPINSANRRQSNR